MLFITEMYYPLQGLLDYGINYAGINSHDGVQHGEGQDFKRLETLRQGELSLLAVCDIITSLNGLLVFSDSRTLLICDWHVNLSYCMLNTVQS